MAGKEDVERIREALAVAAEVVAEVGLPVGPPDRRGADDPSTELDRAIDRALRRVLPRPGEGWLSEEGPADPTRLGRRRVWLVDAVDGTRELVRGLPEWSVSIGLSEDGVAVAGGVLNPCTGELFLGSADTGLETSGLGGDERPPATTLAGALVLVSRREHETGEWPAEPAAGYRPRPTGSVAYRLALVAAGRADATWSRHGRREWDVAGGVAVAEAAGVAVRQLDRARPRFNRLVPRVPPLCAASPALLDQAIAAAGGTGTAGRVNGD